MNCMIINVFFVTYDQFNASLLIESINFFTKKKKKGLKFKVLLTLNFWMVVYVQMKL